MSDFSDIEIFALIVKLGNMAAAAQQLGVTPPVVTRRLAHLERRLGVRLMNRTTRTISLTPEGETYLMEGVRLMEELSALEGRLGIGRPRDTGQVTVGSGRCASVRATGARAARVALTPSRHPSGVSGQQANTCKGPRVGGLAAR